MIKHNDTLSIYGDCLCRECLDEGIVSVDEGTHKGEFIIARWYPDRAQWQSTDAKFPQDQGYRFTFSRTLRGLATEVRTYPTRGRARDAIRRAVRAR